MVQADGKLLDGGVTDDLRWQRFFDCLSNIPTRRYYLPRGPIGRSFIAQLIVEFEGVMNQDWNSERLLVFQIVILQKTRRITDARSIKLKIKSRLLDWSLGKHQILVESTIADSRSFCSNRSSQKVPEEEIGKLFNSLLLQGKLRPAVRLATERGSSSLLMPGDTLEDQDDNENDPRRVIDKLHELHPDAIIPDAGTLFPYNETPELPTIIISADNVGTVASRLQGGAGLSGVDSQAIQFWLIRMGKSSSSLRETIAKFTSWLSNTRVPWPSIRALMSCRLVAVNKSPGVRPIGIGESWRRLFAKCNLLMTRESATVACGVDQLSVGLKAGIESAIHSVNIWWDPESQVRHISLVTG